MADTFGAIWRRVWLHVPMASPLLVQHWCQATYAEAIRTRRGWSFLRREAEFVIPDMVEGTAGVTRGSTSVEWLGSSPADFANRQFRKSGKPLYTILSVDGTTLTLDRPWADPTESAAVSRVYKCYITMPEGFARWIGLRDTLTRYRLNTNVTDVELQRWDPPREFTGADPRCAANYRPDAAHLLRYELWPHPTATRVLAGHYFATAPDLADDDELPWPLVDEVLMSGALAEASSWPGTEGRKNPMFNLALAKSRRDDFTNQLALAELHDEDVYLTWLATDQEPTPRGFTPHPSYDWD